MMKQPKTLKNSKKAWAASLLLCLAFILSLTPGQAHASKQIAVYEVYAGGIHAVQATLTMEVKKDRYDLKLSAKTRGLLGRLAPWQGTFESNGWVLKNGSYQPQLHRSTSTWKNETEIKSYNYTRQGGFKNLVIQETDKPEEKRKIDKALTQKTTDVLTATLTMLSDFNQTGKCEGSDEIFDGKRRFKQTFQHQETTTLSPSRYNIFEGDAAICTVEVTPIAGKWHKKPRGWLSIQEQGRDRGLMPTVWVGKMNEDKNIVALPTKLRVKTAYGTLFMHLAEYRSGDKIYVAEKRVTNDE